ncbi:protein of unknown function [Taphrina deformans PYCC 5710]|uniref:Sphingolipid long chain base-responsive protein PIL1 n=1 Tax=Taphrina deformans (strain PYCC 5710 / ATCC 11124 / CBS 356.35 / IMI 108563 / JCM 9778 / NBRC 8474) TaxID=1097556 RepID=R4XJP6_TAPDE|nr:protein of unknown function [Taphrina deformans PYCC 5710]|eukprot:CCG84653.1 protein of unknown function [Taphrina deformans PYCC 5710]
MNRSRSLRSSRGASKKNELSNAMYMLIKTENAVVSAYEGAATSMHSVAHQLSAWGGSSEDDHISDISDKLGVLLSEVADVEENYAAELEESRLTLKTIRNTESSVQPSRDHREKLMDQIHHLKHKDPQSSKLDELELALVRAEAENLVAEAQLTNIQRHGLKSTYLLHFAALIERSEKNLILAEHGRRILEFLDDTPVVPGDAPATYRHESDAKQVLLDCEEELKHYQPKHYDGGLSRVAANGLPENDAEYENASIYDGTRSHHQSTDNETGATTSAPLVSHVKNGQFSSEQQSSRAPIAQVTDGIAVSKDNDHTIGPNLGNEIVEDAERE